MIQGCSPASASSDCGWLFPGKVEVQTWWETSACSKECEKDAYRAQNENDSPDAEAKAVNVVQLAYDRCDNNPSGDTPVVFETLPGGREDLARRVHAGQVETGTMTLVHLNAGSDVWTFASCSDAIDRSLAPLGTWETSDLAERIPKILKDKISCVNDPSGTFYAVPVGIHRLNVLFFNVDVVRSRLKGDAEVELAKLKAGTEFNLESFIELLVAIHNGNDEKSRRKVKPIVVADDAWPMSLLLAENVMLAAVGNQFFEHFWGNNASGELVQSIEDLPLLVKDYLDRLAPFIHMPDCYESSGRDCTREEALDEVKRGNAAFTVMGDWVMPDVKDLDNVDVAAFPGTGHYFVYTADVLAVPAGTAQLDTENAVFGVLKTATSAGVQSEYALAKNSLPLTSDFDGRSLARSEVDLFGGLIPVPGLTLFTKSIGDNTGLQGSLGRFVQEVVPTPNIPIEPPSGPSSNTH